MIVIGQFKETHNNDMYPSIFDAISDTPSEYKDKLVSYLKKGKVTAKAPGYLHDRISGGVLNNPTCYTDGIYGWRSDLIYYVEKYNVALPDDFVRHALGKNE